MQFLFVSFELRFCAFTTKDKKRPLGQSNEAGMRRTSFSPTVVSPFILAEIVLVCLFCLMQANGAWAWGFEGHRVVGSIATELLGSNAKAQVQQILNPDGSDHLTLRLSGPWADCVKSVKHHNDTFEYVIDPEHYDFEVPCRPFKSDAERARMVDYASRNWTTCPHPPGDNNPPPCHNTFHFDDVAIQRDHFDRSFQGTNEHDLVAAIVAAIAVLQDKPVPPPFPFSIKDKKEALMLLTHFVGDLHQPLHVGSVYLDPAGKRVDPDTAPTVDASTSTVGGNAIHDQNVNLHGEWDDIPNDIGDAATRDLMAEAKSVPPSQGPIENWPADWATDTIQVAHHAFEGVSFQHRDPDPPPAPQTPQWNVSFDDHTAYLWLADITKRKQLAKARDWRKY
jgi:S1/P1 Nuclease